MNLAGRIPIPTPPAQQHHLTTPQPVYVTPGPHDTAAPAKRDGHEDLRLRSAAHRAARIYPGPIGQYLEAELLAAADWGYRLSATSRLARIVDHIMRPPDTAA